MTSDSIDAWLRAVQRWMFRRELHRRLGNLLEHRAYDPPPGAIPGLPVNWPSPSTNTPNVDTHPLEHYWSDREPLDAPWSDANGDEIERGDVTLP